MKPSDTQTEREALYALLARLYTYALDPAALQLVAGLSDTTDADPAISAALHQMQEPILGAADLAELVETLNCEATRLFEGPGQPAAPPFGSYYLNGRRLMGPEALEVRRRYLAMGVAPDEERHVPPDHLALELGFMAVLAAAESAEAHDASREFLSQHLLTWLPAWRADMVAAKPHPFFAGLALFTEAVLTADLAWLSDAALTHAPGHNSRLEDVR